MSDMKLGDMSAFPHPSRSHGPRGMTLRDWFAGQFFSDALAEATEMMGSDGAYSSAAYIAYQMADAMLREREKERNQ